MKQVGQQTGRPTKKQTSQHETGRTAEQERQQRSRQANIITDMKADRKAKKKQTIQHQTGRTGRPTMKQTS